MPETNLLEYIPPQMLKNTEFKEIAKVENIEFDVLKSHIYELLNNQFVHSATDIGLKRWENILNLVVQKTDTTDARRFRILSLINQSLPYTYGGLVCQLKSMGIEHPLVELDTNAYILNVKIRVDLKNKYDAVYSLLGNIVPANLIINLIQLFNEHATINEFRHSELSKFKYKHIKEEVIDIV